MWELDSKLERWDKGEIPPEANLDIAPFGRSDVGWEALRDLLKSRRDVDAPPMATRGSGRSPALFKRGLRRLLSLLDRRLSVDRLQISQDQVWTALREFFAILQVHENESLESSRQLLELRRAISRLDQRIESLEKRAEV